MITHAAFIRPSRLKQLDLCPGAAYMEAAAVKQFGVPIADEAANMGTQAHALVAAILTGDEMSAELMVDKLDRWTQHCVRSSVEFARALIEKYKIEPENILVEHRLDGADLGLPNGGTADLILVVPFKHVIVIDWKFTFVEQDDAEDHDQAASYCMMAARSFKCDKATAFIFTPRSDVKATGAEFDANALRITDAWVRDVTRRANDPDAELNPSFEACKFCRALAHCPAVRKYAMKASEALQDPLGPTTPAEYGKLADDCKLMEKLADAGLALVKQHCTAGGEATGWTIGEPMTKKVIEDAEACFNVCDVGPVYRKAFFNAVTISRTELDRQLGGDRSRYAALIVEKQYPGALKQKKAAKA